MKINRKSKLIIALIIASLFCSSNLTIANNEAIDTMGEEDTYKYINDEVIQDNLNKPKDEINENNENIGDDMTMGSEDFDDENIENKEEAPLIESTAKDALVPIIWDGSSDISWFTNDKQVYEISTPSQLAGLGSLVNDGNPMNGIVFELTNDIYLNADDSPNTHQWLMIGNDRLKPFGGSLDGKGHTVYNVFINRKNNFLGFIGQTTNQRPLSNITITGSIVGTSSGSGVAGIIAQAEADITYLTNIINKANISSLQAGGIVNRGKTLTLIGCRNEGAISSTFYAGGLVGLSDDAVNIIDCHNTGSVTGTNGVGGLVGFTMATYQDQVTITKCTNQGIIPGKDKVGGIIGHFVSGSITDCANLSGEVKGDREIGGIAGAVFYTRVTTTIQNCINKADVYGKVNVGGIIASLEEGQINNCINEGDILVNSNYQGLPSTFGGIAGQIKVNVKIANCTNKGNIRTNGDITGGIVALNSGQVTNCIQLGNIYYEKRNDTKIAVNVEIGLISGMNLGSITSCINKGDLDVMIEMNYDLFQAPSSGTLNASPFSIGGISGRMSSAEIINCVNEGNIYVTRNNQGDRERKISRHKVGGIVGYTVRGKIEKSYNSGNIHIEETKGVKEINDQFYMGGIVGDESFTSQIKECINKGELRTNIENTLTGGITGQTYESDITDCIATGDIYDDNLDDFVPIGGIAYSLVNANKGSIKNSYFSGEIHIERNDTKNSVFGIVGKIDRPDKITNAYYDMDALGYEVEAASATGTDSNSQTVYLDTDVVKGLHTNEMIGELAKTNMTGFDFENMWVVPEDKVAKNDNMRYYPSLKSNPDIKSGVNLYQVSFDEDSRYEIQISEAHDATGLVLANQDYEFKLVINEAYKDKSYVVKDNKVEISPVSDTNVYKLSNIQENHKITVEFKESNTGRPSRPNKPNSDIKTGWYEVETDWYYNDQYGKPFTGWVAADKDWYYVDQGKMLINSWIAQDATGAIWYYVKEDGKMVKATIVDGYVIDANGYCFMEVTNQDAGWHQIGSDWYYNDQHGKPFNGWVAAGENWYYVNQGKMLINSWIAKDASGTAWYYVDQAGSMVTSTLVDGYVVDANGICFM